jgi:transglutaminase-like putative cysteine protease
MTILNVRHTTIYRYSEPVGFGVHRLLFRPRDSHEQRMLSARFDITPEPADVHWIHDVFGNCVAVARFEARASELRIETAIALDHTDANVPDFRMDAAALTWPVIYDDEVLPDLAPTLRRHYPDGGEVEAWARQFVTTPGVAVETGHVLMTMTAAIKDDFRYTRRTDPGTQTPLATLTGRSGTCRDFALLMMEAARSLGFAARFVTGYIYVPARDRDDIRGGGATHAWVQVFLPGAGWVEFDPTNGIVGSRDLIRVGVARDPREAKPLSGSFVGARETYLGMTVEVKVSKDREAVSAVGA